MAGAESVEALEQEKARLENALRHLERSNRELQVRGNPEGFRHCGSDTMALFCNDAVPWRHCMWHCVRYCITCTVYSDTAAFKGQENLGWPVSLIDRQAGVALQAKGSVSCQESACQRVHGCGDVLCGSSSSSVCVCVTLRQRNTV